MRKYVNMFVWCICVVLIDYIFIINIFFVFCSLLNFKFCRVNVWIYKCFKNLVCLGFFMLELEILWIII